MKMFSVIFCSRCGSTLVDVAFWKDTRTATIRCCDCHQSTTLTGFTLGRTSTETCSAEDFLPMGKPRIQMFVPKGKKP